MIDIHNHILPNVDDGAKSLDEALEMIKQAKRQGVTGIIVTPHHLHPRYNNSYDTVQKKLDELSQNPDIKKLGVELFAGQEVRILDEALEDINSGAIKGLNNSKYLLIEFPSGEVPKYAKRLFFELQNKGFTPIIAHPERNKAISNNPNILFDLINSGALSQITSSSLNGDHGKNIKKLSIDLIEHQLVHFIASDAHNTDIRPFLMNDLLENNSLKKVEDEIKELFDNGKHVINNGNVPKNRPLPFEKRKKFLGLF
ncbi:capsular biosynthesis protein [Staphylococcus simulans]|uniref:tyrosine-protein phosphatase n=1 Tax=Staphylococcus simulans TaxID=1286 RepID=UPI001E543355|nr:CpsB/CapC family capsule biosynthesis tyrosine phosphatase [Staphylococcus simulans]MCD8914586.1 capsular biosynthesis protein [Staphylococcus simulans]